jgi:hypothetical protein
MSMGREQKVLVTDTALYDKKCKKGPKRHRQHLLGHRSVFSHSFHFFVTNKGL